MTSFFQPVEENINHLVEALRDTGRNPDVAAPQLGLISASKEFIQVGSLLIIICTHTAVDPEVKHHIMISAYTVLYSRVNCKL